jgi:alpha-tubulin suppressor-like RCC1 family protein
VNDICMAKSRVLSVLASAFYIVIFLSSGAAPFSLTIPQRPATFPLERPRHVGSIMSWAAPSLKPSSETDLTGVVALSAGSGYALVLKEDGTVRAWGAPSPITTVPVNLSNVVAVAAGYIALALKEDGTVVSWGDPTKTNLPTGLNNVVAIAAGTVHCVALKNDGGIVSWGTSDFYKQISIPQTWTNIVSISAGNYTTAALEGNGVVHAIGYNEYGETNINGLSNVVAVSIASGSGLALHADGTVIFRGRSGMAHSKPMAADLTNIVAVSAGFQASLVLREDGTLEAWGENVYGRASVEMGGFKNIFAISSDGGYFLALKETPLPHRPDSFPLEAPLESGFVTAWGSNDHGESAVALSASNVVAVAAGSLHSLALKSDGAVIAWGDNGKGQTSVPVAVTNAIAVVAGSLHSLALDSAGRVHAWGDDAFGQASPPDDLNEVVAVAAGANHSVALTSSGRVVAWGANNYGQINVPPGLSGVVAIAVGEQHALALKSDGTVVAWGGNDFGETTIPNGLGSVARIAAGNHHSIALRSDGTVVAWGDNAYGQTSVPAGLRNVTAISARGYHTVGLKEDRTLVAWGSNFSNESIVPPNLGGIAALAAGATHNLAVKNPRLLTRANSFPLLRPTRMGTPVTWGQGAPTVPSGLTHVVAAEPGVYLESDGTVVGSISLTNVTIIKHFAAVQTDGTVVTWGNAPKPPPGVVAVDVDCGDHCLALNADGTVVGWGANEFGQSTPPLGQNDFVRVSVGSAFSMGIRGDGTLVAWGLRGFLDRWSPAVFPAGLSNVVSLSNDRGMSAAVEAGGNYAVWGQGYSSTPVPPKTLTDVADIQGGEPIMIALKKNSSVVEIGRLDFPGNYTPMPVGLNGVFAIGSLDGTHVVLRGFASAHAASAKAQVVNGFVVGLVVTDGGYGYSEAPTVMISGGGGSGATAVAQIENGVVTGFTITNAGSGYISLPDVHISAPTVFHPHLDIAPSAIQLNIHFSVGGKYQIESSPDGANWTAVGAPINVSSLEMSQQAAASNSIPRFRARPVAARATAQVVNGFVVGINLIEAGGGYSGPPIVTISDGGGSGAAATAQVSNGAVTSFNMQNAGIGYTSVPQVEIGLPQAAAPQIEVSLSELHLIQEVLPGLTYQIESSTDLSTWTAFGDTFSPDTGIVAVNVPFSDGTRFFQLREVAQ